MKVKQLLNQLFSIMNFSLIFLVCVSLIALLAVPTLSSRLTERNWDPVMIEVPGYAKRLMGGTNSFLSTSWYTRRQFYSFRSIHYASPTTKEKRFLPPEPTNYPYPDDEIYNAIEISMGCPQNDEFTDEDCLILSIYTPYLPGNASDPNTVYDKNLPVMFWLHGGAFSVGHNVEYEPQTFMEFDMVVVQCQYRLGPLGFLSLDTDEVPGNAAMFDMIEGLRWVNKFIKYFGGDPNKVTIMGQSAGGASVAFLMLAPQAKGLFHQVIGQAGSMLADWALDRNARENGLTISKYAGCPLEPYADLLHCLRTANTSTLRRAQSQYSNEDHQKGGLGFGGASPVIQYAGAQRSLTREPRAILEDGDYNTDVKIMFGANKHEGAFAMYYVYEDFIEPNGLANNSVFLRYELVPLLLNAVGIKDDTRILSDTLYDKYLGYAVEAGEEENLNYLMPGLIDLTGVVALKAGGWETVRLHTKFNPNAYWYSFDFRGRIQLLGDDNPEVIPPGVSHADELMYLWTFPVGHVRNVTEKILCERMLKTWTNFIRFGDPSAPEGPEISEVPKFLPYNSKDKYFMAINSEWELRKDYTNYYTVSVDDLYGENKNSKAKESSPSRKKNRHPKDLSISNDEN